MSWTATVAFPTVVVMGCGRTVAMEVVAASLTIPEFWIPPPAVLALRARLFTAVALFEQPLFKLDWNVIKHLKAQVTNISYCTLMFYKFSVRLKTFSSLTYLKLGGRYEFSSKPKKPFKIFLKTEKIKYPKHF